jgi:hypothetical protein
VTKGGSVSGIGDLQPPLDNVIFPLSMKNLFSIFLTVAIALMSGCTKHPASVITVSLQGPPLKDSPTEKPFPAYTKTLDYLKSDQFKAQIQAQLSARKLTVQIDPISSTTLFKISVTVDPDKPLDKVSTAIKSTIDSFGASEGEKFVIFSKEKG